MAAAMLVFSVGSTATATAGQETAGQEQTSGQAGQGGATEGSLRRTMPTTRPTGVVSSKLPDRPGVTARGSNAQSFVASVFGSPGGEGEEADEERPWLVLIGPDDATRQAEERLPKDVAPVVRVNRYEASQEVLTRFGIKKAGAVQALLMGPDGNVAFEGAFDLREVVDAIRKLLGLESDSPDEGGWLPFPLRPRVEVDVSWISTAIAFAIGLLSPRLLRSLKSGLLSALKEAAKEAIRDNGSNRPNS
jgi:hypothetical protein